MILLLKYWKLIAVALLLGGTFYAGWATNGWRRDAAELAAREDDRERFVLEARQSQKLGRKLEDEKNELRELADELQDQLDALRDEPAHRAVVVDDVSLRIINCALAGKSTRACERNGAVPAAKAP